MLDPAVGTGTFILAAAQRAVTNVATSLGSGAVQAVLDEHILRDFYGLELLPAPYTIAHVKLALFAREHHATFRERRARIYLTNTLGDPLARADDGGLLAFFVPGLIEEAAEAERVKSDQQILVIVGNPPYSAASHNKQPEIERLLAAWKTIDGRAGSPQIREARIALNDDYLKFMRWAVWKLLEQPGAPGHGILAFVTNHGFVWNRLHRGVRKALLDAFDEVWVFNLHGNQRLWVRGRTDEKVFPEVRGTLFEAGHVVVPRPTRRYCVVSGSALGYWTSLPVSDALPSSTGPRSGCVWYVVKSRDFAIVVHEAALYTADAPAAGTVNSPSVLAIWERLVSTLGALL